MNVFVLITAKDRPAELAKTVAALFETNPDLDPRMVKVADASKGGNCEGLGLSAAINAMIHRLKADYLVWLTDDVQVTTPEWIASAVAFGDAHPDVGLISGRIDNFTDHGGRRIDEYPWGVWWDTPWICTPTIFTPAYLRHCRYVDELAPDHLWGYEDNLACHRARVLGLRIAILENIRGVHAPSEAHDMAGHGQLAARWAGAYQERCAVILSGKTGLDEKGYPV